MNGTSAVIDVQHFTAPDGGSAGCLDGWSGRKDAFHQELAWTPNA